MTERKKIAEMFRRHEERRLDEQDTLKARGVDDKFVSMDRGRCATNKRVIKENESARTAKTGSCGEQQLPMW